MKKFYFIIVITFLGHFCKAQYKGGNEDGYDSKSGYFVFSSSSGGIFNGSSGDGYTKAETSSSLAGEFYALYGGSVGDGYDADQYSGSFAESTTFVFSGGIGDGFVKQNRGVFLSDSDPCGAGDVVSVNDDPIISGLYQSTGTLNSVGKIRSGAAVEFISGREIILLPGFLSENNSVLGVSIGPCLTNPFNY